MLGNFFGGMFGGGKPPMMDMNQGADAIGQAAAGAPLAFGGGSGGGWMSRMMGKFNAMDPMQKAMLMGRMGQGFRMGSGGVAAGGQMPQMQNPYRPMAAPQPGMMFDPRAR